MREAKQHRPRREPDEAEQRRTDEGPDEEARTGLLQSLETVLEGPMVFLAFVWLVLLLVEFTYGLTRGLQTTATVIWVLFGLDFLLRFSVAPRKLNYLRKNLLTAISLVVPALRVFRVFQAIRLLRLARAARGVQFVRLVASMNRGMRALKATMVRRGVGYVTALTLIVLMLGAAGMHVFEGGQPGVEGFDTYPESLWWTAMLLTTIGSEYWPRTSEGRLLCLLLAIYSVGILGYVAGSLASFFVGRERAGR